MHRREFLKIIAGGGVWYFAERVKPLFPSSELYDVGIARGKNYPRAVEEALNLTGGIKRYVKPGSKVVVKPNIAWNSPPELKANTDPLIVRTVVDLCFKALAAEVYVFDRTCNNPRLTYVTSGIAKAAESAGAKVLYVNDVTNKLYPKIQVKGAEFLKETTVIRYILESDLFINVPVAKHHSSAGLTLGMKNLMGITGDNRSKWHWELHRAIADINLGVPPDLTIIDATYIMTKYGPTGGSRDYLKRLDTIIASPDVVSADTEATALFGIKPKDLGYLDLAASRGMGRVEGYSKKILEI